MLSAHCVLKDILMRQAGRLHARSLASVANNASWAFRAVQRSGFSDAGSLAMILIPRRETAGHRVAYTHFRDWRCCDAALVAKTVCDRRVDQNTYVESLYNRLRHTGASKPLQLASNSGGVSVTGNRGSRSTAQPLNFAGRHSMNELQKAGLLVNRCG